MDGLLLRIARDLIVDFQKNGLAVGRVRIKIFPRDRSRPKFTFRGYASGDAFVSAFDSILLSPNYLCSAGSLPVIENIELDNGNLSFHNSYSWTNILDRKTLAEKLAADYNRDEARAKEAERYKAYMSKRIDQYVSDAKSAVDVRIESYVDPCYVDAGYVSPQSEVY